MEQFKRAQVVMLSHNNINTKITLYKTASGKPLNLSTNVDILTHHTNQHLYITSDDKIKKDDWYIYLKYNTIIQKKDVLPLKDNCKKIIATTDTSLKIFGGKGDICDLYYNLPQPSQQFIEKYIESYNKGEVITDVLVEYEDYDWDLLTSGNTTIHQRVKVNPKDNTITIKKLKNSWNREEVIRLLNKLNNTLNIGSDLTLEQWIEENL